MFGRFIDAVSSAASAVGSGIKTAAFAAGRGIKATWNAVPGAAIVAARGGSAIWYAYTFSDWLADYFKESKLNSKSPFGITLASAGFIGAIGTATVTRFFNLYAKDSEDNASVPNAAPVIPSAADGGDEEKDLENPFKDPVDPESQKPQQPNSAPVAAEEKDHEKEEADSIDSEVKQIPRATFCHPGINPNDKHFFYKLNQMLTIVYASGSGFSSILSIHSLIRLLQQWIHFNFDDKCDDSSSNTISLLAVNAALLVLAYANVRSLVKYNFPAIREYYRKLFLEARLFTLDHQLFKEFKVSKKGEEYDAITAIYDINGNKLPLIAKSGYLHDTHTRARLTSYPERIFYKNSHGELAELTLVRGWKEISKWNLFEAFVGATLGSIAVWYGNQNVIKTFQETTWCHMMHAIGQEAGTMPDATAKTIAAFSAITNFLMSTEMTTGAMYNKQEEVRKEDEKFVAEERSLRRALELKAAEEKAAAAAAPSVPSSAAAAANPSPAPAVTTDEKRMEAELEQKAGFGCWEKPIKLCGLLNQINMSAGMFNAAINLVIALSGDKEIGKSPFTITFAAVCSIIVGRTQRKLDEEGFRREVLRRIKELEKQLRENRDAASQPAKKPLERGGYAVVNTAEPAAAAVDPFFKAPLSERQPTSDIDSDGIVWPPSDAVKGHHKRRHASQPASPVVPPPEAGRPPSPLATAGV